MKNIFFYLTQLGSVGIVAAENAITDLYFPGESIPEGSVQETALLKEAGRQLQSYLAGKLTAFSLPLAPVGTKFQQRVWKSLCAIPYGETRSYKEIASDIGSQNACRAVGQANHRNPIPIFIPCHRVIGADGQLTGYGGGLEIKAFLLQLEKHRQKIVKDQHLFT